MVSFKGTNFCMVTNELATISASWCHLLCLEVFLDHPLQVKQLMYLALEKCVSHCDYLIASPLVPALPFYNPTPSSSPFVMPVGAGSELIHPKPQCDSTK